MKQQRLNTEGSAMKIEVDPMQPFSSLATTL
jgi:hypothetical protein